MSNCETVAVTFDVEDIAVEVVCVEPQIEVRVTMSPTWADVSDKPAAFAPSAHAASHAAGGSDPVTLSVGQVSGLQAALDSKATPADVTAAVSGLVNSAPAALDTLNELAAALGNDANFASTVTTALAAKAPLASPTFTGTVGGITKGMVGLGNVDNTADASKPVSTAQAAADAAVASAAAADATSKANAAQAAAVQRANHTGTQAIATVDGLQAALDAKAAASHGHDAATTSAAGFLSAADKTKLDGIATGATANATDAQLRDRATHTGTQAASTITGLGGAATLNVGTTAGTVAAGNDARLSDTRTPTAGSVTDASITSGGLSTSSLNWAAIQPWAANTAYSKGDLVSNAGIAYRRSAAGTSGATFNTANWQQITPTDFVASQIASGTIATARLGSGTASNTTFLRGDQSYATVCDTFIFTRSSAPASASGSNGSYTWSVPATAKFITLDCTAGGGGGGSGRRGAAGTVRGGGGGGGGGGRTIYTFPLSEMADRGLTINVGAGGAGGAAVSTNDTNGNAGASGGHTDVRITNDTNGWLAIAWRGNGGGAGTTSGGAGGAPAWANTYPAANGGAGGTGAVGGNAPLQPVQAATAGGGGGGISAGDTAFAGGETYARSITRNIGNTVAGGAVGANGGNGAAVVPGGDGNGGSGGGASITTAAGAGGNGSAYGGGGGGGGASLNGFNSGAGGNGGDGVVRVTVWY